MIVKNVVNANSFRAAFFNTSDSSLLMRIPPYTSVWTFSVMVAITGFSFSVKFLKRAAYSAGVSEGKRGTPAFVPQEQSTLKETRL